VPYTYRQTQPTHLPGSRLGTSWGRKWVPVGTPRRDPGGCDRGAGLGPSRVARRGIPFFSRVIPALLINLAIYVGTAPGMFLVKYQLKLCVTHSYSIASLASRSFPGSYARRISLAKRWDGSMDGFTRLSWFVTAVIHILGIDIFDILCYLNCIQASASLRRTLQAQNW
jgi:hypothetical protein